MAVGTRERILNAALEMISQRGYEGTNLRELAASIELSKSALYRHFDSKEAIWEALLDELEKHYEANFGRLCDSKATPASLGELCDLGIRQVDFTLHDPVIVKTRRVLAQEQFRDAGIAKVASLHLHEGLEDLYAGIFARMMANGTLPQDDPHLLALEYVAPGIVLIQMSDRDPQRTDEAFGRIKDHIERFCRRYERHAG